MCLSKVVQGCRSSAMGGRLIEVEQGAGRAKVVERTAKFVQLHWLYSGSGRTFV